LAIVRPSTYPEFYLIGEQQHLCIKTPLLQAIRDIPIYAKFMEYLCVKKPRRKSKDPPIFHFLGKNYDLILGKEIPIKYDDPRNPVATI